MDFHGFYKNSHFHIRIFITFRRWVVLTSRWLNRFYKHMHFHMGIFITFRRWVVLWSRWVNRLSKKCYFHTRIFSRFRRWVVLASRCSLWLFPKDYHIIRKLTVLLRLVGCCQLNKTVIICRGLPHILVTESRKTGMLIRPYKFCRK